MYKQNTVLTEMLEPLVSSMGYELLGIETVVQGRGSLIRLYIDKGSGITADDCEHVSHQVVGLLDVQDPVHGSYTLEVSSPGLDRPLFTLEHFQRFIGHRAQVRIAGKFQGRRRIVGVITDADEQNIVINEGENSFNIPADMIEQARLIPEIVGFNKKRQ